MQIELTRDMEAVIKFPNTIEVTCSFMARLSALEERDVFRPIQCYALLDQRTRTIEKANIMPCPVVKESQVCNRNREEHYEALAI